MKTLFSILFFITLLSSCNQDDTTPFIEGPINELYFPPNNSNNWEVTDHSSLGWNTNALTDLYQFLESNNSRAFIILKDGKIVLEQYWGNTITNNGPFNHNSHWYWASAGKSLMATLVGIAQQEGHLNINQKTSDYLGSNWTSLSTEQEDLITIKHQLTMTTGLNYQVADLDCTEPSCLTYGTDAGAQWYYHNAPYRLLRNVITNATQTDINTYTNQKIGSVIGMNGQWLLSGNGNPYWSTARDMARFGLLMLNRGTWDGIPILHDSDYYNQMVNSSQSLNPSYGYLWWLNGKSSIIIPGLSTSFNVSLSNHAPNDLIAAMGKNGQFIDIVPSQNLVVIRMGEAPDNSLVPVTFHDEMWNHINLVMNN